MEEEFPDTPSLLPSPHADAVTAFLGTYKEVARTLFTASRAGEEPTEEQAEAMDTLAAFLDSLEAQIEKNGGPFLFGDFSLADITVAPFLPRLVDSCHDSINLSKHPNIKGMIDALAERPSVKATRVDDHTNQVIRTKFFAQPGEPVCSRSCPLHKPDTCTDGCMDSTCRCVHTHDSPPLRSAQCQC